MTLEQLNKALDEAIKHGEVKPQAMKQTNILNASYANGEAMAILKVINTLFGIDAFCEAAERTREARNELLNRTQDIYNYVMYKPVKEATK